MKSRTFVHRRSGFTLVELLVGFAILATLMLIAVPEMLQRIREANLRSAAEQVSSLLRVARLEGVRGVRPGIVETLPWSEERPLESFRAFADIDRDNVYTAGADRLLGTYDLPSGIELVEPDGLKPGPAVFQPTGAIQNVVWVDIRDGRGNELRIEVSPTATARVTVWKLNPGPAHVLDTLPEEWL
ncbi:MAG TPA: GspH/FimT family pseudopilin [Thermoanaerobaculia bacterium]|nr:GspH/FimT family pseudopilin [Thermoanaerobaculia bacterium]